jgi:SagB-type dehydrogenase family enzyme
MKLWKSSAGPGPHTARRFRMNSRIIIAGLIVLSLFSCAAAAADLETVRLPEPERQGGMPLMEALNQRKTSREFSSRDLPEQLISNMLWAAFGVNRPESGKRTAPSAVNWQEIQIFLANAEGVYRYNHKDHTLEPYMSGDIRSETGRQRFTSIAPVNLIYVADHRKMKGTDREQKIFYSAADTGFISQNVYLFCASENLATVVIGAVDKEGLEKVLKLEPYMKVILTQTVGYPAE